MHESRVRIWMLLGVLGLLFTAAEAGALNLSTVASVLTAPFPTGSNEAPNCQQAGAGGPTSCATTAGAASFVADLWSLGGLVDTRGIRSPGSPVHTASGLAHFIEDLSVPGAPAGAQLIVTFQLTGTITLAPGATTGALPSAGFAKVSFLGGGMLVSATNASMGTPGDNNALWSFGDTSGGAFSETVVARWALSGAVVPGFGMELAMNSSVTGFAFDFLNTLELDKLEAIDEGGNPLVLDVLDPTGQVIGTTVPEPGTALLLTLGVLAACRRPAQRREGHTA